MELKFINSFGISRKLVTAYSLQVSPV